MEETFTLILDREASSKLAGYDLYRSQETNQNRPVINGFYVQRGYLEGTPNAVEVTIEVPIRH
jgi:hypothetical protein